MTLVVSHAALVYAAKWGAFLLLLLAVFVGLLVLLVRIEEGARVPPSLADDPGRRTVRFAGQEPDYSARLQKRATARSAALVEGRLHGRKGESA